MFEISNLFCKPHFYFHFPLRWEGLCAAEHQGLPGDFYGPKGQIDPWCCTWKMSVPFDYILGLFTSSLHDLMVCNPPLLHFNLAVFVFCDNTVS